MSQSNVKKTLVQLFFLNGGFPILKFKHGNQNAMKRAAASI